MNFLIEQNIEAKNITFLESFGFEIDPLTIRIEDAFINSVMKFVDELFLALGKDTSKLNPFEFLNDF